MSAATPFELRMAGHFWRGRLCRLGWGAFLRDLGLVRRGSITEEEFRLAWGAPLDDKPPTTGRRTQ